MDGCCALRPGCSGMSAKRISSGPPLNRCFQKHRRSVAALAKANTLAGSLAEEVQLGAADYRTTLDLDLLDLGRVNGKLSLDPFARHDSSHNEHFSRSGSASGDHRSTENLNAFLVPFLDLGVHIDGIADSKLIHIGFEVRTFNSLKDLLAHD